MSDRPKMVLSEERLKKVRKNASTSKHPHIMIENVVLVSLIDEILEARKESQ